MGRGMLGVLGIQCQALCWARSMLIAVLMQASATYAGRGSLGRLRAALAAAGHWQQLRWWRRQQLSGQRPAGQVMVLSITKRA